MSWFYLFIGIAIGIAVGYGLRTPTKRALGWLSAKLKWAWAKVRNFPKKDSL